MHGIVYDEARVCDLLGLTVATGARKAPAAVDGEIVIWSPGLSLCGLRDNPALRKRKVLWDQDWYNTYPWSAAAPDRGYYAVQMPVPGSNRKVFAEQVKLLRLGEQPIPVALAALTWYVHRVQTGNDLLNNDWTRCAEQTPDGDRVEVYLDDGRMNVYSYWDGIPYDRVWFSSSRRTS